MRCSSSFPRSLLITHRNPSLNVARLEGSEKSSPAMLASSLRLDRKALLELRPDLYPGTSLPTWAQSSLARSASVTGGSQQTRTA